jgi:hypothetical protein
VPVIAASILGKHIFYLHILNYPIVAAAWVQVMSQCSEAYCLMLYHIVPSLT